MAEIEDVMEKLGEIENKLGEIEVKVQEDRVVYYNCASCNGNGQVGVDPTGCPDCGGTGRRPKGQIVKLEV